MHRPRRLTGSASARLFLVLLVLLAALAGPADAAPRATLVGAHADHAGVQQASGVLAGLRIRSSQPLAATFLLEGRDVSLHTVNLTTGEVAQAGVYPQRGGTDRSWAQVSLESSAARADLDFLVVPLDGQPPPAVSASSRALGLGAADRSELVETAYVDSSRPVLRGAVGGRALASSAAVDGLEVSGAFAVSVWSWDFTADDGQRNESFPTGVHQSGVVRDPATGRVLSSTDFDQVAQLRVGNGTLRLGGLSAAEVSAYSPLLSVSSVGHFALPQAAGLLDAGGAGDLAGRDLSAEGTLSSTVEATEGGVRVALRSFEGTMTVAGRPVSLGASGPLREAGAAGGGLSEPASRWGLGIGGSLAAVALAALVAKGPARRAAFNRIEGRFEAQDYRWVLRRIGPFTGRPRYRPRATLLKAVSLISLEDYQEAALFLETLDPTRGPDAATKAFLQACAAAGQGQDDVVLERLGACFRLDPSYLREARFVPILAGYLPYFSISPEFA